jgi:hypothetical protein
MKSNPAVFVVAQEHDQAGSIFVGQRWNRDCGALHKTSFRPEEGRRSENQPSVELSTSLNRISVLGFQVVGL